MRILTLEDKCFKLNKLPEEIDDDVYFSVLDNSDVANPDFFFVPLIFLESFSSPAMVLKIGNKEITMPLDWNILIGSPETGNDLEVIPLTSINSRGFDAFIYNPLSSFRLNYAPVEIVNFYSEVKWYFPKMKNGQLLTVPLTDGNKPPCAYFVKDIPRQCEVLDYSLLVQ
jgi:hypothetical protein